MTRRKRQGRGECWSAAFGRRGETVTVYERTPGGILWARVFDPELRRRGTRCPYRRVSLKHRDKKAAGKWALAQAHELAEGLSALRRATPTADRILDLYLQHATPDKGESRQGHDRRCAAMWKRILGSRKDLSTIRRQEWDSFIADRTSGTINPAGERISEATRRPVRARTVVVDLDWLRCVIRWACLWQTQDGVYLMSQDPTRGYKRPKVKNVRRPVATTDRYEAIRGVSDQVMMEQRWDGKRTAYRSYLSELVDLAYHTARRINAICCLTYADLRLDDGQHGSVRWPGDRDKEGETFTTPMNPEARRAIDRILRDRPGIGAVPLFPSPTDRTRPLPTRQAHTWLHRAETLAELEPQEGSLWHAYRRGWATARKHLPDVDVAKAGGWKTTEVLKLCYQQATDEGVASVVMADVEVREAR